MVHFFKIFFIFLFLFLFLFLFFYFYFYFLFFIFYFLFFIIYFSVEDLKINANAVNESGYSVLHFVANKASNQVVLQITKYLIDNKADVKQMIYSFETPLYFAIRKENVPIDLIKCLGIFLFFLFFYYFLLFFLFLFSFFFCYFFILCLFLFLLLFFYCSGKQK